MPPNSPRVTSVVSAPSSAARRAAMTPAGPAPTTTTFRWASSRWAKSVRVVDDQPEIVALDDVPGEEFPMRTRAERPVVPRRPAALGTGAEVAVGTRVGTGSAAGLLAQLPRRE